MKSRMAIWVSFFTRYRESSENCLGLVYVNVTLHKIICVTVCLSRRINALKTVKVTYLGCLPLASEVLNSLRYFFPL